MTKTPKEEYETITEVIAGFEIPDVNFKFGVDSHTFEYKPLDISLAIETFLTNDLKHFIVSVKAKENKNIKERFVFSMRAFTNTDISHYPVSTKRELILGAIKMFCNRVYNHPKSPFSPPMEFFEDDHVFEL